MKTTVYRKDFDHPVVSIARFDAYASTYRSANGPVLTEMWTKRGPEQLAKCSEMLSLRRGWPEELGGVYLDIELKNENDDAPVTPASVSVPTSVVPVPPSAPKVNQAPAVATETPRPGESGHISGQSVATTEPQPVQKEKVEAAKEAAIKAVPELKPASELPAPKKKGGRPKKEESE